MLAARVVAGAVPLRTSAGRFFVCAPSPRDRLLSQEAYREAWEAARQDGSYSPGEAVSLLVKEGLWSAEDDQKLSGLPKDIDTLKSALYLAYFRSKERERLREELARARAQLHELETRKSVYDHVTCEGVAGLARARMLMGCSLRTERGKRVFSTLKFWDGVSALLDEALEAYSAEGLGEGEARELARTEPWGSLWASRRAGGLFGRPVSRWSDEQRLLVKWSFRYDTVWGHPERPPDEVVSDDDCLDGWWVEQRKKADTRAGHNVINSLGEAGKKGEVFIPADTPEDARKVYSLNDPEARSRVKSKFSYIGKVGTTHDHQLPDVKQRIILEARQKASEAHKQVNQNRRS